MARKHAAARSLLATPALTGPGVEMAVVLFIIPDSAVAIHREREAQSFRGEVDGFGGAAKRVLSFIAMT